MVSGTGLWVSGGSLSSSNSAGIQMFLIPETTIWETELMLPKSSFYI